MTLILRRLGPSSLLDLGAAGWCRVSLTEIVGLFGTGPVSRVLFLGER